eukprot:scaffold8804_cov115-Isochrysis_galbana.AAC.5
MTKAYKFSNAKQARASEVTLPFTPSPDLAQGFNATELGELGRWERKPQEKADARQAAAILAGGAPRRPELSDPAAAMSLRYSSGQGRSGCHDA